MSVCDLSVMFYNFMEIWKALCTQCTFVTDHEVWRKRHVASLLSQSRWLNGVKCDRHIVIARFSGVHRFTSLEPTPFILGGQPATPTLFRVSVFRPFSPSLFVCFSLSIFFSCTFILTELPTNKSSLQCVKFHQENTWLGEGSGDI